jgi:hypothetical protein
MFTKILKSKYPTINFTTTTVSIFLPVIYKIFAPKGINNVYKNPKI